VKILADTCAWSLLLRRKKNAVLSGSEQAVLQSLTEAIRDGRVAVIGPIRQEVLSGIKDLAQFKGLRSALERFRDDQIETCDYVEAALLFNLCRSRGVECGSIDMLICAAAIRQQYAILTNDQGLLRCIAALRAEGMTIPAP